MKINRRSLLASGSAAVFLKLSKAEARFPHGSAAVPSGWRDLKIGGGGQLTYISQSLDGATTIINTDTAGPFLLNASTGLWVGLVGQDTVPSAWCLPTTPGANLGIICYGCVVAPSNKDIGYMVLSHSDGSSAGFFKCSNLTAATPTWTLCSGYTSGFEPSNNENSSGGSNGPMMGPRLAVDPNNSSVCYIGTSRSTQQPQVTLDGGTTFHTLTGIPSPTVDQFGNAAGWCIDGSGGTTSNTVFGQSVFRSAIVWAGSHGNGIYRSTTGDLTTWTAIAGGSGGPGGAHYWSSIDPSDGQVYVTTDFNATGSGTSGFYTIARGSTSWSSIITDSLLANLVRVVPDPFVAGRVACINASGNVRWNTSHGSGTFTGTGTVVLNSPADVPWLNVNTHGSVGAGTSSIAVGGACFDNAVQNKLWVCDGIGLWFTTSSSGDAVYTSKTAGISQLVTNRIKSPWTSGSPTLVANWDRAIFATTNPEVYPSGYGPNYTNTPFGIEMGWDVDWASAAPGTCVLLNQWQNENSAVSTDGGQSWSLLANGPPSPSTYIGGCIAMSDSNHILVAQANQGDLIYTTNQAATPWVKADMGSFGNTPAGTAVLTITGTASNGGHVKCTTSSTIIGVIKVGDNPTAKTGLADITGLGTNNYVLSIDDATHFTVDSTYVGPSQSGTLSVTCVSGNTNAYYTGCFRVAADRVASNQFYYANSNAAAQGGGFYKITFPSGTFTMTRKRTTPPDGVSWGTYFEIKATPYNGVTSTSGHVIWSAGYNAGTNLYFSHDEGATWDIVGTSTNAVGQTFSIGWGATKPGNDYPSLYFYGYVNGVLAIWQIDASAAQWTAGTGGGSINIGAPVKVGNLSDLPRKFQTDWCGTVEGDANIYGQVYLGFKGAGSAYRKP